jgi:hypothetical protein
VPFRFSAIDSEALPVGLRLIEDRRNNPVRNRETQFRLMQQNILAYTFPFVPGFTGAGINNLLFKELVDQPLSNADLEGAHFFGADYDVSSNARAKVAGDIFEEVEAAIHWNTAARWNTYAATGTWPTSAPRYSRPSTQADQAKRVAVLSLPRRYDWVRLLDGQAEQKVKALRDRLGTAGLTLPTSTPDLLLVVLPDSLLGDPVFRTELPDLSIASQGVLDKAYKVLEGKVGADGFLLAVALKKSLRSDRLYQPLYEANVMQIILEGDLQAEQVDFEVHTLDYQGTKADETYSAASLGLVASNHANPHRAIRQLYQPPTADAVVRRLLLFLDHRAGTGPTPLPGRA